LTNHARENSKGDRAASGIGKGYSFDLQRIDNFLCAYKYWKNVGPKVTFKLQRNIQNFELVSTAGFN